MVKTCRVCPVAPCDHILCSCPHPYHDGFGLTAATMGSSPTCLCCMSSVIPLSLSLPDFSALCYNEKDKQRNTLLSCTVKEVRGQKQLVPLQPSSLSLSRGSSTSVYRPVSNMIRIRSRKWLVPSPSHHTWWGFWAHGLNKHLTLYRLPTKSILEGMMLSFL